MEFDDLIQKIRSAEAEDGGRRKTVSLRMPMFKIEYDCDVKGILKSFKVERIYVGQGGDSFDALFTPVSFSPKTRLWWALFDGR